MATSFSEQVAVCLVDFLDESMSAEQSKESGDGGGLLSLLGGRGFGGGGIEYSAQVFIAEAGEGELAAIDGDEQGSVLFSQGV